MSDLRIADYQQSNATIDVMKLNYLIFTFVLFKFHPFQFRSGEPCLWIHSVMICHGQRP